MKNIKTIKTIFFDLDNTLFDHTRAERTALVSLMKDYPEIFTDVSQENFLHIYHKNNIQLWKQLSAGEISAQQLKVQRFELSLKELNCDNAKSAELSQSYFEIYSKQSFVLPNVEEILIYLKPKYELGILSNGFKTTQEKKLQNIKLDSFFTYKIYSGDIGAMKPSPEIFNAATRVAKIHSFEVVYVGDSYDDDIKGAKAAGWHTIHYVPQGEFKNDGLADYEIWDLLELKQIL